LHLSTGSVVPEVGQSCREKGNILPGLRFLPGSSMMVLLFLLKIFQSGGRHGV
jgi:hypothetical protein